MKDYIITMFCLTYYVTSAIMYIPSTYRILKRKSSTDYSIFSSWLELISTLSWSVYIFTSEQTTLVYLGTVLDIILTATNVFAVFRYHNKE